MELARLRADLDEERARRDREGVSGSAFKEIFDAQTKVLASAVRNNSDKPLFYDPHPADL